jgi:hypothetical protein
VVLDGDACALPFYDGAVERALLENEHIRVVVDDVRRVVRTVRSSVPYASTADATRLLRSAVEATRGLDRAKYGFVMDLRQATGRNDPAFETAIAEPRKALFAGYARRAVLVRTLAGKLQEQRLSRAQSTDDVVVFDDEAEATKYAAGL